MGLDAKTTEDFVRWPDGGADRTTPVFAATMAFEARNRLNIIIIAATAAATINLDTTVTLQPQAVTKKIERFPGDKIIFVVSSDGTGRDITFGTGMTAPVLAGVANKTKVQELTYINSTLGYVASSAPVQID